MMDRHHIKNRFSAITQKPIVQFQQNFAWWSRIAIDITWQNANLENYRWTTATILIIVK